MYEFTHYTLASPVAPQLEPAEEPVASQAQPAPTRKASDTPSQPKQSQADVIPAQQQESVEGAAGAGSAATQSDAAPIEAAKTRARTVAQCSQAVEATQRKDNENPGTLVRSSGPEVPRERYADGALDTLPCGERGRPV